MQGMHGALPLPPLSVFCCSVLQYDAVWCSVVQCELSEQDGVHFSAIPLIFTTFGGGVFAIGYL